MPGSSTESNKQQLLGLFLGLFAASSTAVFLLCFRSAAHYADRNTIVFAMLLAAAVFNSSVTLLRWRVTPKPNAAWLRSGLFLAVMTLAGNIAVAAALPRLGAGVTSTMMQLQFFIVAFGAWFFLRERVSMVVLLGGAIAIAGFVSFAFPGFGDTLNGTLNGTGLLAGLATALAFAAMLIWTRAVIRDLDPVSLNAGRLWMAVATLALWPGVVQAALAMPWQAWLLTTGAAATGPFLGRLALMYALRYITAAKTKLLTMLSPVFTFLLAYLIYAEIPSNREIVGGVLIAVGVLLPTLLSARATNRVREQSEDLI